VRPDPRRLYWALRRLGERRTLLFFDAPASGSGEAAVPAGFVLGTAGPAGPPGGLGIRESAAGASGLAERLRDGHRLLYVQDEGRTIVAWGWLTLAREGTSAVPFECGLLLGLGPAQAYLWDFTTLPQARRRGLYSALLRHGRALAAEAGIPWVAIYCRRENAASAAGIRASGFEQRAGLAVARAGPLRRLATATGARRRAFANSVVPLGWILGHAPTA